MDIKQVILRDFRRVLNRRTGSPKAGGNDHTCYCIEHRQKQFIVDMKGLVLKVQRRASSDKLSVVVDPQKIERVFHQNHFFWRLRVFVHWSKIEAPGKK